MSAAGGNATGEWVDFARCIANVIEIPANEVRPDAKLMPDLGLDSIGLAELAVTLRETYESSDRRIDLEHWNWETVTVGQLFKDLTGSPAPSGATDGSA